MKKADLSSPFDGLRHGPVEIVRRTLAHRRDDDADPQNHVPQLKFLEQNHRRLGELIGTQLLIE
jgi:hypothetical protein